MKKILLVEDNLHVQEIVCAELEDCGFEVSTALNGKEALEVLKSGEKPNLVIMDMRMPKMNGSETIGHMIKMKYYVPLIIYTGYKSYKNDYLSSAADAYVIKSSDLSELVNKVKELA